MCLITDLSGKSSSSGFSTLTRCHQLINMACQVILHLLLTSLCFGCEPQWSLQSTKLQEWDMQLRLS